MICSRRFLCGAILWSLICPLSQAMARHGGGGRQRPEPLNQVQGFYAKGSLQGASALSADGIGYVHLFSSRGRFYASEGLISILGQAAGSVAAKFNGGERLQVGDLSAPHGGQITGHSSHQNGLDVDVVYYRINHQEQAPEPADGFHEHFVKDGRISINLDQRRTWLFIKTIAATGRLNRIFMDPIIKAALCKYASTAESDLAGTATVLKFLRPLEGHDDHMHLRFTCPAGSPHCIGQDPVPSDGSGCPEIYR